MARYLHRPSADAHASLPHVVPATREVSLLVRWIGGIAGIGGGGLLSLEALLQQSVGQDPGRTTTLSIVGLASLVLCEVGLVVILAGVRRRTSQVAAVVLGVSVFLAAIGLAALVAEGSIAGIPYAAIGLAGWFLLAPVLAVLSSRAGLLSAPLATAMVTLPIVWWAVSALRLHQAAGLVAGVAYALSWSWLGYALLRAHPAAGRAKPDPPFDP